MMEAQESASVWLAHAFELNGWGFGDLTFAEWDGIGKFLVREHAFGYELAWKMALT